MRDARDKPDFVVLDIDGTLLDLNRRKWFCLQQVLDYPISLEMVKADYGLENFHLTPTQKEEFFNSFLSGKYINHPKYGDVPYSGSVEVVNILSKRFILWYATGRHHNPIESDSMKMETLESLKKFRFPPVDNERVKLIMKPHRRLSDKEFKRSAIRMINAHGRIRAIIGNRPTDVAEEFLEYTTLLIGFHDNSYSMVFPSYVKHASSWEEIKKILIEEKLISPKKSGLEEGDTTEMREID